MQNRLLRLVQRPAGVYHCSVFHQFSGRLGPSGIARDPQGNLYVTRYDFASQDEGVTKQGVVSKISPDGKPAGSQWPPLGSTPARLLRLLGARLAALGGLALPERETRPTGRPDTAAAARVNHLQSSRFHPPPSATHTLFSQ